MSRETDFIKQGYFFIPARAPDRIDVEEAGGGEGIRTPDAPGMSRMLLPTELHRQQYLLYSPFPYFTSVYFENNRSKEKK